MTGHPLIKMLSLRARIGSRALRELSVPAVIVLLALVAAACYAFYELCDQAPQRFWLAGALAALLLCFHLRRSDYYFCRKILPHPFVLFLSEYFLVSLPFLVLSLVKDPCPFDAVYGLLPVVVAALPRREGRSRQVAKPFRIPMPDLDTVSFFRRCGVLVWGMLGLALALCFAPWATVILVYLLVLFSGSAFSQSESLTLLCLEGLPAKKFLDRVICRQIRFWATLTLPVLAVYAVFHLDTAWQVLLPIVLCPLQIVASVSAKYRSYNPNRPITGPVSLSICMLGFLIPFFLPVSVILTFVYYRDAIRHLETYLYAYDR